MQRISMASEDIAPSARAVDRGRWPITSQVRSESGDLEDDKDITVVVPRGSRRWEAPRCGFCPAGVESPDQGG